MTKKIPALSFAAGFLLIEILGIGLCSCGSPDRPKGWTAETHGNGAISNYEVVLAQNEVKRLDVTISSTNWRLMLDDMTELLGEFGTLGGEPGGNPGEPGGEPGGEPPSLEMIAGCEGKTAGGVYVISMENGEASGTCVTMKDKLYCSVEGGMRSSIRNPIWVPCTVEFEGKTWWHVGVRFKGNTSCVRLALLWHPTFKSKQVLYRGYVAQ
jgi:hypothetical protein